MPNVTRAGLAHSVRRAGGFALLLACLAGSLTSARAAVVDIQPGVETTNLAGTWKFHPGDDPSWADPGLDDSSWADVTVPGQLQSQGYAGMDGVGWYRIALRLPAARGDLGIAVGPIQVGYEIYASGRRIGSYPDDFRRGAARSQYRTFAIPAELLNVQPFVIAIRMQGDSRGSGFSPGAAVYIGARTGTEAISDDANFRIRLNALPWYLYPFAFVFVPLMLALYWNQRDRGEYLWAASFAFLQAVFGVFEIFASHTQLLTPLGFGKLNILLNLAMMWARVELLVFLFGETRIRVVRVAQWIAVAVAIATVANTNLATLIYSYQELTFLPFRVAMAWIAVRCLRSKSLESRFLAVLALIEFVVAAPTEWRLALEALNGAVLPGVNVVYLHMFGLFQIALTGLINILWMLLITGLVFRRYVVTSREHRRLTDELEAARLVQALLIPKVNEATPGLAVESIYLPAQEVGGDFYQILPAPDGATFVAVGDVSGKGLKAAMVVSSIVGGLQVERSCEPSGVLASLNRMLVKEMDGGFVTCCCALFHRDGSVTIANAGHVAPYLDGEEMAVSPGLPLGVSLDVKYHDQHFNLGAANALVFLSDGVIEARNQKGELFGFERTRAISMKKAEEIALEAQSFGQHDDITVVSIRRLEAARRAA